MQEEFHPLRLNIIGSKPEEFSSVLRKNIVKLKWPKVVKHSDAKAD